MLYNNNLEVLRKDLDSLVSYLQQNGWTINPDKIQKPGTQVTILGINWSSQGRPVPEKVINKLDSLKSPTNKKKAQQLMGLFMFLRQHIPYLADIAKPIYKVTKKAIDFVWNEEQEQVFQQLKEYIHLFSILQSIRPGDKIVLDIAFLQDHGHWGLYKKSPD